MSEPATSRSSKKRGLPSKVRMRHEAHFVDELVGRSEAPVGRMIALSAIEPDPNQPRVQLGDLQDLVSSVREKGVLEPILVRSREDGTGYRIISGERRYRAAMEAGLYEIPAIEMDISESEALEIALIENLQRKDLTPFEEAEGYRALATQHDYTHEEVSRSVGKSRVSVTESLSLLKMPKRVRSAVDALGIDSKTVLLEVMKLDDEDEMILLLERISSLGLSRKDVRRAVKKDSDKGKPARPKPYVFKFKAPDKRFDLSLTFRQEEVDRQDLIGALEQILSELRELEEA